MINCLLSRTRRAFIRINIPPVFQSHALLPREGQLARGYRSYNFRSNHPAHNPRRGRDQNQSGGRKTRNGAESVKWNSLSRELNSTSWRRKQNHATLGGKQSCEEWWQLKNISHYKVSKGESLKQVGRANILDIVLEAASKTGTRGKYSLLWP